MRSPGGRRTTSGSTPCSQRSPTSAPPPTESASQYARCARTWPSTRATQCHNTTSGTKAWIAVPPGTAEQGYGTVVTLSAKGGKKASVYGKPGGTSGNIIGSTPAGSVYLSPWSVTVSGMTWYAINYNHRQAWVPASEVTSARTT